MVRKGVTPALIDQTAKYKIIIGLALIVVKKFSDAYSYASWVKVAALESLDFFAVRSLKTSDNINAANYLDRLEFIDRICR